MKIVPAAVTAALENAGVEACAVDHFCFPCAARRVAGSLARTLGMRHFDSQILGGWVIFNGKLAEMQTGEGKTLTATLPASVAAMAGVPVHVITSNDYLASRDAQLMRPLYEALGLSVGVITEDGLIVDQEGVIYEIGENNNFEAVTENTDVKV